MILWARLYSTIRLIKRSGITYNVRLFMSFATRVQIPDLLSPFSSPYISVPDCISFLVIPAVFQAS